MTLPTELRVNAWIGGAPAAASSLELAPGYLGREIRSGPAPMKPGALTDLADWRSDEVGWGLVLPEDDMLTDAEKATPKNCPEPIQHLWEERGRAPVLRYDPEKGSVVNALRRYYANGAQDPDLVFTERGTAPGKVPHYLLIYGTPAQIPWQLQYDLGHVAFTGRLTLTGDPLENYVTALCDDWSDASADPNHAVVWSAFHGNDDITALMLGSIASKVADALAGDNDIGPDGVRYVNGALTDATHETLRTALEKNQPGLVVTTSHGCTDPLDDVAALRADLGKLIDSNGAILDIDALLSAWEPGGAIWYSHACCSAGTVAESAYKEVVAADTAVGALLDGLTAAGDVVAPLPEALLGAPSPLRAFVGHVEPTFDWTLQHPRTGQILTNSTRRALYDRLYQPYPIGYALDELRRQATQLKAFLTAAKGRVGKDGAKEELLALQLTASDRESLVILGDPTAVLPELTPANA